MHEPPSTEPVIEVNVHSLTEGGTFLEGLGKSLAGAVQTVSKAAQDGLGAIPESSDLYESYAFCWGRWSAVLDDAHKAVAGCGTAVKNGGQTYKKNDDAAGHH